MQRQTLLVSVAVFALLACAAWFLSVREPAPKARVALPASTTHAPPSMPPAAPVPSAPAAATIRPATPPAATADARVIPATPAEIAAPTADAGVDTVPEGVAIDAPTANATAAQSATGTPADVATTSASPPADQPSDAARTEPASGEDARAAASTTPAPADPPHEDRAVDLFAERIEALEDAQGDDDVQDARAAAAQHAYDARDEGGDAAKAAQANVHDLFANWLAGLQLDGGHPSLISIDCRSGACRVLIAQGGIDFTNAAQLERESPVNMFTRLLLEFSQNAVWSDAGLVLQDSQMKAAGGTADKPNDIALWTIYLRVPVAVVTE